MTDILTVCLEKTSTLCSGGKKLLVNHSNPVSRKTFLLVLVELSVTSAAAQSLHTCSNVSVAADRKREDDD